jgi:hypothetical protein
MTGSDLLIEVLLLALATGAVVDVWFNGSIFAHHRARIEALENIFSELMGCSLCLNYQTAIWLTCGLWVLPMFVPGWAAIVLRGLLVALAVARLAWLINCVIFGPERGYDRGGGHEFEEDP